MDSENKRFIPCIYLRRGQAARSLTDETLLPADPVTLAVRYTAMADGLIIFDQSKESSEHEMSMYLIRRICSAVDVPVCAAGHINNLDDMRALYDAGCSQAAVNFSRQDNIALLQQAAAAFGREHVAACYRAVDLITNYRQLVEECVGELILIDETSIREALAIQQVPAVLSVPDISLDKVLEFFSYRNVNGITGNAVNDNVAELGDLKRLCRENGIRVALADARYDWDDFKTDQNGLVPVVTQEASTRQVLMVAYMNREAYEQTVRTGIMTYFSRSRQKLWVKGETSGHFQYVKRLYADCDFDTILAQVAQIGAACHTGHHSCFFNEDLIIRPAGENHMASAEK